MHLNSLETRLRQPHKMSSRTLGRKLKKAIEEVCVLFDVKPEELQSFEKFELRRTLRPDEHPGVPRSMPGYDYTNNYFFFPAATVHAYIFHDSIIRHEASHYVHFMINKKNRLWTDLETVDASKLNAFRDLKEIVAEYPNNILGDYAIFRKNLCPWLYDCLKRPCDKYGPDFLPKLARMDVYEAIDMRLVPIDPFAE